MLHKLYWECHTERLTTNTPLVRGFCDANSRQHIIVPTVVHYSAGAFSVVRIYVWGWAMNCLEIICDYCSTAQKGEARHGTLADAREW